MWLFFTLATTLLWGVAELFYKKGSHENEKFGHLKVCVIVGAVMGITYMVFELPNSFIKRRLDIADGKTEKGLKGKLFFVIDQLDSMFGVILVLAVVSKISFWQYINYVLLGGLTHICVNLVLYKLKIRRNL